MWRRASLFVLCMWVADVASATSSFVSFDSWLKQQAAPALVDKLAKHPKYRGRDIEFLSLQSGGDSVSVFETRLQRYLSHKILQAGRNNVRKGGPQSCRIRVEDDAIKLGIEILRLGGSRHEVRIAGFDIEEGEWLSGLSFSWVGRLGAQDRADLAKLSAAGGKTLDLGDAGGIAKQAAAQIVCAFPDGVEGEIYFAAQQGTQDKAEIERIEQRLKAELALRSGFFVVNDAERAQWKLAMALSANSGSLQQLVLRLEPTEKASAAGHGQTVAALFVRPHHRLVNRGNDVKNDPPRRDPKVFPSPGVAPGPSPEMVRSNRSPERPRLELARKGSDVCSASNCREVDVRLPEAAYALIFSTTPGGLKPIACSVRESWRDRGVYRFRLKAQQQNDVVGFYVVALNSEAVAHKLLRSLQNVDGACGLVPPGGAAEFLAGLEQHADQLSWQALHLKQGPNRLAQMRASRRDI